MGKARTQAQAGVTFDTGALVALERGDGRMLALLQQLAKTGGRIRVPAGVLGQAWRNGSKQAVLAKLLRSRQVEIRVLDARLARSCGELCAFTGTADVIDASVVLTAREHHDAIITSDVADLERLAPNATLARI